MFCLIGIRNNRIRFKKNSTVAIETFISTNTNIVVELNDGWTLVGNKGGHESRHEQTILITVKGPVILTKSSQLLN